jgi:hypothetical protein
MRYAYNNYPIYQNTKKNILKGITKTMPCSIKGLFATLSINDIQHNNTQHKEFIGNTLHK